MHSPSARALCHLDRYCIVLVHTLKHVSPAKCVITITYRSVKNDNCIYHNYYSGKSYGRENLDLDLHRINVSHVAIFR